MIDFSSTLSFCGLDFFPSTKTHFASQTSMKQEGNTGQAPGSTMRFVKPASWMKLLLSDLFPTKTWLHSQGSVLFASTCYQQIRWFCIQLSNLHYPISIMFLVGKLLLKSWLLNVPNSSPRLCAVMPYKVQRSWWVPSATCSEKIAGCLWNCPEIWTENIENTFTIAAKLKKKHLNISYCAVIASQNISLRLWGMSWHNDTLFLLLGGRVARKSRGVLGAHGPWQVSESSRRICESFKVFWTSSHFCSACLPLVTLNSYANLTKWNFYASNLDLNVQSY